MSPPPDAIAVGRVSSAHALGGQLRVRPYHPDGVAFAPGRHLLLETADGWLEAAIVSSVPHGRGRLLVRFTGVDDRTAAEGLRGATLYVDAAELPPPADDEFYYHEILGFRVETEQGEALGAVVETMSTGLNDVWVVRNEEREHLIPVIDDVVHTIDRAGRRIVISPIPGLLD